MREKQNSDDVESSPSIDGSNAIDQLPQLVNTTERKLMAKVDLHVVPVLCVLYLLAFLDRVNISNARLFSMEKDLGLEGTQFNTALVIFFVPYIICEIPANVLLKKLKPHVWLSLCMFLFGLVTMLQGFVQNYAGLLVTRFFLGVFESGMFPGCFYLMSMWYKRTEAQKRYSFFFSSTTLAGAFGGLLASAIGKMDGMRGYFGWRWIFILEGLLTCVVSFAWFFAISDFPEEVKWLTEEERTFIKAKLVKDVGKAGHEESLTWRDVVIVLKDWKVIIGGFMYFGLIVPAYGYAYFAPTIIKTYGYSPIKTQLYSTIPWAAAFGFCMIVAYASDHFQHRFSFSIFCSLMAIAGFAILITVHGIENRHAQFGALCLVTMGAYTSMPVLVCWYAMNLSGHKRRSVGTAWQVGFGNIGGIIATYSFVEGDAPFYTKGYAIALAFICLSLLSSVCYLVLLMSRNRRRVKQGSVNGSVLTAEEEAEDASKGDLSVRYRYQL